MMKGLLKELKAFAMVASAAWVFGFMGMLGANQAAKLIGVSVAIAYESPSEPEKAGE
jgi:hypothetical protein